jgi:hypothetical protein
MDILTLAIGWIVAGLLGALGLIILVLIALNRINLTGLISEPGGDASMSRFQLLIFTFVIALSFLLVTFGQNPPKFPEVPAGVFALLGISSGSYIVSKGIQASRDIGLESAEHSGGQPTPPPAA